MHGVIDELVHRPAIAEAHFGLGRVHIDIHRRRVDLDEQGVARVATAVQHVLVGLAQGVGQQLVADEAAVHEDVLGIPPGAGPGGLGGVADNRQPVDGSLDAAAFGEKILAQDGADPAGQIGFRQRQADPAVVGEGKGHARMSQGDALHRIGAVGEFGAFGLQEFAAGRGVVIEVPHFHHGAGGQGGRFRLAAAVGRQLPGMAGAGGAAGEGEAGHRRHRGQGLAAEAQGGHPFQVFQAGDLAGGVAGQGQGQFFLGNAAAVVADPDQFHPALFQLYLDGLAARVQGVFQHLLEDRGGPFHHLAGGDLADEKVGQETDGHGGNGVGDKRRGGIIAPAEVGSGRGVAAAMRGYRR